METESRDNQLFQQLFCLITELHHVVLHGHVSESSFRGQGRLVNLLAQHEGVSQRELAVLAQVKPGSISEVLERLEKAQQVARWRDHHDRRIVRVKLTAKGQQLYRHNQVARHHFESVLLKTVTTQEQDTFNAVVQKMRQQLRDHYGEHLAQEREEGSQH